MYKLLNTDICLEDSKIEVGYKINNESELNSVIEKIIKQNKPIAVFVDENLKEATFKLSKSKSQKMIVYPEVLSELYIQICVVLKVIKYRESEPFNIKSIIRNRIYSSNEDILDKILTFVVNRDYNQNETEIIIDDFCCDKHEQCEYVLFHIDDLKKEKISKVIRDIVTLCKDYSSVVVICPALDGESICFNRLKSEMLSEQIINLICELEGRGRF